MSDASGPAHRQLSRVLAFLQRDDTPLGLRRTWESSSLHPFSPGYGGGDDPGQARPRAVDKRAATVAHPQMDVASHGRNEHEKHEISAHDPR